MGKIHSIMYLLKEGSQVAYLPEALTLIPTITWAVLIGGIP